MHKRNMILLLVFAVFLLFGLPASGESQDSFTVSIAQINRGEDGKSCGEISESVFSVEEGQPVRIDMSEVFDMYPEHNGIYGVMYSANEVTITAMVTGNVLQKAGKGVLEFSFPGATECTVSGSGKVYAYFLPVPYMRLSTQASQEDRAYDPAFATATADGHSNLFILADPHSFIYQLNVPHAWHIYKTSYNLGPIPSAYSRFSGDSFLSSWLYETPVLYQCSAFRESSYLEETFTVRPLRKYAGTDTYEIWAYNDLVLQSDVLKHVDETFAESLRLAEEQFLAPGLKVDKILVLVLGNELGSMGLDGRVVTNELYTEIGLLNLMYINGAALSEEESWDHYQYYLFAHEIGHIVQRSSLSYHVVGHSQWYHEGFATYFGEKVCRRLGKPYNATNALDAEDSAEVNKFHTNLVFGIDDPWTYEDLKDNLVSPKDAYSFGSIFFRYLEAKYGEGFFKRISSSFYENFYKGHESRFFYRRNEIDKAVDTFFGLIRKGLSEDVFIRFPEYLYNNMADLVVRDVINPDHPLPGDVNGDGLVDGRDAIRLMKYLADEEDPETGELFEIHPSNSDINSDGTVDEKDLLRLMINLGEAE